MILANQTKISEQQLKIALFEDRVACVHKMRDLYIIWQMNGRLEKDDLSSFVKLFFDVELLFPKNVSNSMSQASEYVIEIARYHRRSHQYAEDQNEAKRKEFLEKAWALEDKLNPLLPELFESLKEATRIGFWDSSEITIEQ